MKPHPTSPWLLIAALVCFLMPFFNVSCSGQNGQRMEVARLNGRQLITGTTSDKITILSDPVPTTRTRQNANQEPPQPIAAVPLAAVDAGLIAVAVALFFVMGRRKPVVGVVASALALASHLWLLVYMQNNWLAAQMKPPPPPATATADASLASLGDAMIQLNRTQIQVSPAVGWWLVCVLVALAIVVQFLPKAGYQEKRE